MKSIFVLLGLLVTCLGQAQKAYTVAQAEILSSAKMYGRSVVNEGSRKAAEHIAKEFRKMGLKTFNGSFYQNLSYPVNTFPSKLTFAVNDVALVPGKDFLMSPESGTSKGKYTVVEINKSSIPHLPNPADLEASIVLLDPAGIADKDSISLFYKLREDYAQYLPVIWVNHDRLVWSVSGHDAPHAMMEVNPGLLKDGDEVQLKVKNKLVEQFQTENVLGYVEGTQYVDSFIVITAHYDHLGMMGEACFYGANDNASGVAFMLSMAQYYAENPAKCSVMFMAFTGEEAGLKGSKFYVHNPVFDLSRIVFLINLDLLGYGEGGIAVVNATLHEKEFAILQQIDQDNQLFQKIKKRGGAANSDHYWFEQEDVPTFFIYTMGDNQAYHDIFDRNENLTFGEYDDIFFLLKTFISKL